MKFLYFGDPHIRGTNPRNRKDNYKEALIAKFREIFALAKYKGVTAIIQPGDTFDRPEVTTSVLLEFAKVLKESPVPIYTTAGNHDIYGYNLATYERTSLRVLELIVPRLTVINDPGQAHMFHQDGNHVQLTFTPYSDQIDKAGYGYSPEATEDYESTKIHVAHGMLLDHDPPFDRYTKVQDVKQMRIWFYVDTIIQVSAFITVRMEKCLQISVVSHVYRLQKLRLIDQYKYFLLT